MWPSAVKLAVLLKGDGLLVFPADLEDPLHLGNRLKRDRMHLSRNTGDTDKWPGVDGIRHHTLDGEPRKPSTKLHYLNGIGQIMLDVLQGWQTTSWGRVYNMRVFAATHCDIVMEFWLHLTACKSKRPNIPWLHAHKDPLVRGFPLHQVLDIVGCHYLLKQNNQENTWKLSCYDDQWICDKKHYHNHGSSALHIIPGHRYVPASWSNRMPWGPD